MMAKLIANKTHLYGTRRLQAGDVYEADEPYAHTLVLAQIARYAPDKPDEAKRRRKPQERDQQ